MAQNKKLKYNNNKLMILKKKFHKKKISYKK